jgi:hypothetical protein
VYSRCSNIEGPNQCIVSAKILNSDFLLDEILAGKRVLFRSTTSLKELLARRVREKKKCGFHIAKTSFIKVPVFMVLNKNFNHELREKIKLRYET